MIAVNFFSDEYLVYVSYDTLKINPGQIISQKDRLKPCRFNSHKLVPLAIHYLSLIKPKVERRMNIRFHWPSNRYNMPPF